MVGITAIDFSKNLSVAYPTDLNVWWLEKNPEHISQMVVFHGDESHQIESAKKNTLNKQNKSQ